MSAVLDLPNPPFRARKIGARNHLEARSRATIDLVGDAVYVVDTATLCIVEANQAAAKMYALAQEEIVGMQVHELFAEQDEAKIRAEYMRMRASEADSVRVESVHRRSDGTTYPVEVVRRLFRIGEREYVAAVVRDMTQRLMEQGRLRRSESLMRDISEAIPDVLWTTEYPSGGPGYASAAYEKVFGRKPPEMFDQDNDWLEAVHRDDKERVRESLLGNRDFEWQDEYRVVLPSGDTRWVRHRTYPVRGDDGNIERTVNIATDITFQREADQLMMQLVQYDGLTGLINRGQFTERIELAIDLAGRNASSMSVVAIDLDHFVNIKGTLGSAAGNLLLCEISRRLQAAIRPGDILARIGSDSFAVALTHLAAQEDAAHVARKLLDACAVPIFLDGREVTLTASAGIALFPGDGKHGEELLCNAIVANARASASGVGGFQHYSADMAARSLHRLQLESDLRLAIAQQQFELHFQPKYVISAKRHCGFEALLRWRHPVRGMVGPVEFIACLEESGIIDKVGAWVIEQTIRQVAAWREQGFEAGPVAVNLAAAQLCKPGLARYYSESCARYGIPPESVEFEVTESTMMTSAQEARDTLQALRELGARVSIDDFGTGYSSLSYLKRLPVDTLKIDRSFVKDLESGQSDVAIVEAIIKLAHALSLDVVAEGVETEGQLRILAGLGCDTIQGYLFSRPLPAHQCDQIAARLDFLRGLDDSTQSGDNLPLHPNTQLPPAPSPTAFK